MSSFLDVHERWLVERGAEPLPNESYPDEPSPLASWPEEIFEWFGSDMRTHYDMTAFALGSHPDSGLGYVGHGILSPLLAEAKVDMSRYPGNPVDLWREAKTCAVFAATSGEDAGAIYWFNTEDLSFGRLASSLPEYFAMVRALVDAGVATVGNEPPRWLDEISIRPDSTSDAPSPPTTCD